MSRRFCIRLWSARKSSPCIISQHSSTNHHNQNTRSNSNFARILTPPTSITRASIPVSPWWCRHFVRNKDNMVRHVLKMEEPLEEKRRKSPKDNWVSVDARPNKSTTNFNLTMGEIMMGKSHSRIAVEGARMVEEGILCGLRLEKLFLLKSLKTLPQGLNYLLDEEKGQLLSSEGGGSSSKTLEIHRIGMKAMQTWSSLTTPPGIIGIFKKPQPEDNNNNLTVARNATSLQPALPVTVICDNIREPGNLGSILRSITGAGCDDVILTKGCVDPWNMKVLRGGSGAHFRIPITADATQDLLRTVIEKKIRKMMVGTEEKFSISICDSNIEDTRLPGVPSIPFRDVDYTPFSHNFVIIGGETEGISEISVTTVKLLQKISSVHLFRIRIPLANEVESLNTANACGIVLFEIVRQLTKTN